MTIHERPILLRIGHSPDPDDAFMWWPLTIEPMGKGVEGMDAARVQFQPVLADIEELNRRAETGELEITAISCAQYPAVQDRYAITSCGCSMGEGYGPKLVARAGVSLSDMTDPKCAITIAVPGERTSAFAALSVMLGRKAFRYRVMPFDEIIDALTAGKFQVGLVIHEGQLTFAEAGLHLLADLGAWWWERFRSPMPLGLNVIRRDLDDRFGTGSIEGITAILTRSVRYALAHRDRALRHALKFARGLRADLADQFVRMYVNDWSIDMGEAGAAAIEIFLAQTAAAGITQPVDRVDIVRPALRSAGV